MDSVTPNLVYSYTYELPYDLELDVWFHEEAIRNFLDYARTLRPTRQRQKEKDHAISPAREALEKAILADRDHWELRMRMFCIRRIQRSTTLHDAAHLYAVCLQLAVSNALQTCSSPENMRDEDISAGLNSTEVRIWLMSQKEHVENEYESLYCTKRSFNAPSEDTEVLQDLCSSLETDGPNAPSKPTAKIVELDLSTDKAVWAFELTADNRTAFLDALNDPVIALRFCLRWMSDLDSYFTVCLTGIPEQDLDRLKHRAVVALTQMRNGPRTSTVLTEGWQDAVKSSGLADVLLQLSRPEVMLKWQLDSAIAPREVLDHVLHSLCFHQWTESLAIILDAWTPLAAMSPDLIAEIAAAEAAAEPYRKLDDLKDYNFHNSALLQEYIMRRDAPRRAVWERKQRHFSNNPLKRKRSGTESTPDEPQEYTVNTKLTAGEALLGFLADHPNVLPNHFDFQSFFFLLDLPHFLRNYTRWIRAALLLHGFKITCKPEDLYSQLMSIDPELFKDIEGVDEKLYILYEECADLRKLVNPTSKVKLDRLRRMGAVTVHDVYEISQETLKRVKNTAFTLHDDDHVQPKPSESKDHGGEHRPGATFLNPEDPTIGLKRVGPIESNLKGKWGNDVHIFWDVKGKAIVGGVIYNALSEQDLENSRRHHALVSLYPNVRRGASFLEFAYGKMVPLGYRVAMGGRLGDGYVAYNAMIAEAEKSATTGDYEDIRMMFGHAKDVEVLFNAVRLYVPEVVDSIRKASREKGLKDMGSCGASSYYCSNYMSPQHEDSDEGWSLCSQLYKDLESAGGDVKDDFNFAYTKWGVYIETRPNCVWWFRSEHLHGTILPTNTTVQNLLQQTKVERQACKAYKQEQSAAQRLRGGAGSDDGSAPGSPVSNAAVAGSPPRTGSGGIHVTVRRKDAKRAQEFRGVQQRSGARTRYWRNRV